MLFKSILSSSHLVSSISSRFLSLSLILFSVLFLSTLFPLTLSLLHQFASSSSLLHSMSFRNNARTLLPFGLDYSDITSSASGSATPTLEFPVNWPLLENESDASKQAMAFSQLLANGPFFTGNVESLDKPHTGASLDGIERHSDKYKPVKKIGRTVEEHPYQLEYFPEELYLVMGISNKQKRLLSLSSYKQNGGLAEYNTNQNGDHDLSVQAQLEKLKELADNLEDGDASIQDNGEEEPDLDDEFEEDEDDDYNAEKYFNDGDDDGIDDGDDEAAF